MFRRRVRERCSNRSSCTLLAPLGTFTALIMPECLYAGLAALAVVVLLGGSDAERAAVGGGRLAASGSILALAALMKPHGLILIAALGVAVVARVVLGGRRLGRGALELGSVVAGFTLTFVVARALSTPPGLPSHDLLGPVYRDQLALLLKAGGRRSRACR